MQKIFKVKFTHTVLCCVSITSLVNPKFTEEDVNIFQLYLSFIVAKSLALSRCSASHFVLASLNSEESSVEPEGWAALVHVGSPDRPLPHRRKFCLCVLAFHTHTNTNPVGFSETLFRKFMCTQQKQVFGWLHRYVPVSPAGPQ